MPGISLERFSYLVGKPSAHELGWANHFQLGDLNLYDVDIGPVPGAVDDDDFNYIAIIGLNAFNRLRVMIRPSTNEMWTQSVSPLPNHNRFGAVFLPESKEGSSLVAKVLAGGPANRAGLENGDELVSVGNVPLAKLSVNEGRWQSFLFGQPAGTRVHLKIKRDGEVRDIAVVLEDLLKR